MHGTDRGSCVLHARWLPGPYTNVSHQSSLYGHYTGQSEAAAQAQATASPNVRHASALDQASYTCVQACKSGVSSGLALHGWYVASSTAAAYTCMRLIAVASVIWLRP